MRNTGSARQIITVTNGGPGTTATLQAYEYRAGAWHQAFAAVPAMLGSAGFSSQVSERSLATPIGFFTLTEAFGIDSDPGSRLPYRHVRYGDVWVDETTSPNYNTLQAGDADGSQGTGEKLWLVTPEYRHAVVIDYNREPVVAGAGSAFFLHVTAGKPTQGCVSVPQSRMIELLRWLDPARHPHIAMGPLADVLAM